MINNLISGYCDQVKLTKLNHHGFWAPLWWGGGKRELCHLWHHQSRLTSIEIRSPSSRSYFPDLSGVWPKALLWILEQPAAPWTASAKESLQGSLGHDLLRHASCSPADPARLGAATARSRWAWSTQRVRPPTPPAVPEPPPVPPPHPPEKPFPCLHQDHSCTFLSRTPLYYHNCLDFLNLKTSFNRNFVWLLLLLFLFFCFCFLSFHSCFCFNTDKSKGEEKDTLCFSFLYSID